MAEADVSGTSPPFGSSTEARMNRDSIKKGFSDFRKFAGTNFFRAKQVCDGILAAICVNCKYMGLEVIY